jgi:MFS transporter, DHA1 family, inner membrane transport protein
VAYEKRGRALGGVEFAWAGAGILGLPIAGWMIDRFGWQSPFFLLVIISLLTGILVWFKLPPVEHRSQTRLSLAEVWQTFLRPNVLASIGVGGLVFVTVGIFITLWGIWLSADFGLQAVALGFVATAIGVAELMGSGLVSLFIDRIGKRRGSQAGLLLTAALFLLLPLTQTNFALAITLLVALGVCLEFSIVALLPLYSEQAPEARATVFSLVALGISIGAASASPLTAILWERFGLWAVAAVAALCLFGAWGLVGLFLQERGESKA